MKNYISEFIGTFAMIFCGTGAMTINEVTGGDVTHVGIGNYMGFNCNGNDLCFWRNIRSSF